MRERQLEDDLIRLTTEQGTEIAYLEDRIERMARALRIVGNIVGAPTIMYAPTLEVAEWRERAWRISRIVEAALGN